MVDDIKFMKEALKEAKKAYSKAEVPVGCVIVKDGKIIGRGHNLLETKLDPTMHAEINAIKSASKKIKALRLVDCEIYVTLEPCAMCAGAIVNARIARLIIGTVDSKRGAVVSTQNLCDNSFANHRVETSVGILSKDCSDILKQFFVELRLSKNKK